MNCCCHFLLVSLVIQGSWVLADQEKTRALLEGDILLTEHQKEILAKALQTNSTIEEVERLNQPVAQLRNGAEPGPNSPLLGATTAAFPKWNEGIIPYTINATLGKKERAAIREAIQEWQSMTCIRFVKRKDQRNYLEFFKGDGCWGTMGMSEGKSQISVGEGCGYRRVMSHEIGHVIGFFHEQSRVDRDEYVDINWWNIEEDMERSFNKYTGNSIDSRGIPYDYGSIMHYPWHAMSINGKDTIVPKKTVVNQPYQKLSQLDAAQTNLMYKEMCQRESVKPPLNTASPPVASTQVSTSLESQQPPPPMHVKTTTPGTFSPKKSTSLKTAAPTVTQTTPERREPPPPLGTTPGSIPPKIGSTMSKIAPPTIAQKSRKSQKPPLPLETTTPGTLPPKIGSTMSKIAPPTIAQKSRKSKKPPLPLETTTPGTLPPKTTTPLKTSPSTVVEISPERRKPIVPLETTTPRTLAPKTSTTPKTAPLTVTQTSPERRKPTPTLETTTPRTLPPKTSTAPKTAPPTVIQTSQPFKSTTSYPETTPKTLDCNEAKCEDKHKSCRKWKAKGLCKKRKKAMSEVCCNSCKTCIGDTKSSCKSWARRGYCKMPSVARLCCKSCPIQWDNCKDETSDCKQFSRYCRRYERHMLKYCCKTCELQRQADSCRDKSSFCKLYQERGYCTKHIIPMGRICKESCGFCDRTPTMCKAKKKRMNSCRKFSERPKEGATCSKVVRAGLENHCINDTALSASSELRRKYIAAKGRLNGRLAWCSAVLDGRQHIMIDLGTVSTVKQIITQGMENPFPAYVSKFYIDHSNDKKVWGYSAENIWGFKMYTGNDDAKHETLNEISPPIIARYIRIHPTAWKSHICLRFELGIC